MQSISKVQELAQAKPRVWRRATIEQRKSIADTYETTGSIRQAFRAIRNYKVTATFGEHKTAEAK